ncbi:MAG: D-sedoheptulose 7-phosphate isomerase [Magnetococcales bacterium]|nr:D-sedoheptulose 7-phosphate isomerase [Magnetococcales bacterium]
MIDIEHAFEEHRTMVASLAALTPLMTTIAQRMSDCIAQGGCIYWMGNGGSAADSQHLAAELVGRFTRERRALASVAFTTDTSILTAVGNDYGYDQIFSRQVEGLCGPKDVVVGISTSGNSPNILKAMAAAREIGAYTVGFTGKDGGALKSAADDCLVVPSPITARIQEGHILVGHILCDWVEASVMGSDTHV